MPRRSIVQPVQITIKVFVSTKRQRIDTLFIRDALARALGMKNPAALLKQVRNAGKLGRPDASSTVSAAMKARLRANRPD